MKREEHSERKQNKAVRNGIDPAAFMPERMQELRLKQGLNKTQAAELLQISKMAYGRYENGERIPSYQYIVYMSQQLGTSPEYLTGKTEDASPKELLISKESEPELFELLLEYKKQGEADPCRKRMLAYLEAFRKNQKEQKDQ